MFDEGFFEGRVWSVQTKSFEDARGFLAPIDFRACGFQVTRAFIVKESEGAVRGGHGHRRGRQRLMLIAGEIDVELRWSGRTERYRLDSANRDDHSSMVVCCDILYDDYIPGDRGVME